ncbi:MAG: helix-turn-helix transcriptional regulator [bacterium]|nr:helix-turn-helix transcriptional regulator [bacterium]
MIKPFIKISYGELLHLFRHRNKLTLKAVAKELGVTAETIKNYENDVTFPSYYKVMKFNQLYGEEFHKLAEYLLYTEHYTRKKPYTKKIQLDCPTYVFKGNIKSLKRIKASEQLLFKLLYT